MLMSLLQMIPPPPPPMSPDMVDDEALGSVLISWYMSGYHTGYYLVCSQNLTDLLCAIKGIFSFCSGSVSCLMLWIEVGVYGNLDALLPFWQRWSIIVLYASQLRSFPSDAFSYIIGGSPWCSKGEVQYRNIMFFSFFKGAEARTKRGCWLDKATPQMKCQLKNSWFHLHNVSPGAAVILCSAWCVFPFCLKEKCLWMKCGGTFICVQGGKFCTFL